jgi:hypothetical protein
MTTVAALTNLGRSPPSGDFRTVSVPAEPGCQKLTPVKVSAAEPAYLFVQFLTRAAKENCTVVIRWFDCDSARGQREQRVHDF